jgi:nucleoside-diphosphate-sugar epimerase
LNQFREEDGLPAWPATTYGWAKILGEIGGQAYHQDFRLKTCSVRIFNCYGERENLDPRWSHVIPSMARKAIRYPKEGFRIFGDGKQERAFLYVKDCVRGLILAMEKIEDGSVINLGSEELVSIGELAKKVAALSGKEIKIEYDLSGPQGTQRYCADTSHLRKTLGWVPDTPLEKGLRNIYQWAEKELNRDKR